MKVTCEYCKTSQKWKSSCMKCGAPLPNPPDEPMSIQDSLPISINSSDTVIDDTKLSNKLSIGSTVFLLFRIVAVAVPVIIFVPHLKSVAAVIVAGVLFIIVVNVMFSRED